MITGREMFGNCDRGAIVFTDPSKGGMSNWIRLVHEPLLAQVMAARSEPDPLSLVLVTMLVLEARQGRVAAATKADKYKEILLSMIFLAADHRVENRCRQNLRSTANEPETVETQ